MENVNRNKMKEVEKWYKENKSLYQKLANKVEALIKEFLEYNKISYHSVTSRAKESESFLEKAMNDKYLNPVIDIKDMAGVRIIAYFDSDVVRICEKIETLFDIDPEHSVDKSKSLGIDRVGYRSVHYIATVSAERASLPEWAMCNGLCFEIQVRSILQHAWAEIEHDRNYKFRGVLP